MPRLSGTRCPILYAIAAAALCFCWQTLTVHYNYGGRWNALYCAGELYNSPPDALRPERLYRFPKVAGYDGQSYHLMAHDPFLRRGFSSSIDAPRFRYRRILVPLLAWTLAFGRDTWIDPAYYAVILASVLLGTWWTVRIAVERGWHAAWGLAYLALPAVLVSLDRMTVDAALAAVVPGAIYYGGRGKWTPVFVLCAAAGLTRESGMLLSAAAAGFLLIIQRRMWMSATLALSAVPAFAWYAFVNSRTAPYTGELISPVPFAGFIQRIVTPTHYPFGAFVNGLVTTLDYGALAAILLAMVYAAMHARRWVRLLEGWIGFAFIALIAVVSTPAVWEDPYGFLRGYSPLIFVTAADGFRTRSLLALMPLFLSALRIGLSLGSQILVVVRGLTGL